MSEKNSASLTEQYVGAVMNTFGAPQRVLVKGEGSYVWDADGNRYLDLLGGIAVNALGHADPEWVAAVALQAGTLAHTSNFFATEPQIKLAQTLLDLTGAPAGSRVFFANSGTEANEAAFKMARRTGRTRVISLKHSFHGRSTGALAMTYKPAIREPFEPLAPGVTFVTPNDIAELEAAMDDTVAAVIAEPIQGESGVMPLEHEYLLAIRDLTTKYGALMILDEIQTGVARTGEWFAFQTHGIQPDVVTLAKGLGGGFPIGAVVAFGEHAATLLGKGSHGTTFGGNALAAAVSLATLNAIRDRDLLANVKSTGAWIASKVEEIPGVVEVRGDGLLLGIKLESEISAEVASAALDAGFIVNPPSPDTIRIAPALNIKGEEVQPFIDWLTDYLATHGGAA